MESFTTSNEWSFAESKMFEAALAALDLNEANWLEKLAAMVPTKTLDQVSNHIANLVLDGDNGIGVNTEINIMENNDNSNGYSTNVYNPQVQEKNDELGFLFMEDDIVLPSNEELMEMEMLFGGLDDLIKLPAHQAINDQAMNKQPAADLHVALKDHVPAAGKEKVLKKRVARRRRKPKRGTGWTEHEHRLFLIGLLAFGKGDWRTIATEFVKTRTSIQVASHAQKFFVRHQRSAMRRRKSSILDITSITTPIVFGSTPTSIYDMIDWHEVAARYQASVCNPIADNNDTSPFWLLMNWCPPTTNNDKASSTYLETNADVRVESFGKPTGFGSFNIAIDSIGVNNMDEEFQNDVDLQAESFGEPAGTYNFGTYAIRVNNMDEECWNNVDLQAESFGEPAGFESSNIGTYAISVDKMNDEVWENADLQAESFGEPAGYISTDAIGVDNMDEGSWDISYLLRSPVLAPMY